ncbi:pteridine reductase [Paraferrimonas sp. SM1919]|uniref:pteridine reductase n=1 Tax=Paraferrimonas sp. SM1919 TaxID=2662263 RepID=UPI0013D5FEAA|nr:pteridine reductase [Paraferrimonas sp. SM1919]
MAPVALITGAAKRIGKAIALELHQRGYNLIIHYQHSHQQAQQLATELNQWRENSAKTIAFDLSQTAAVAEFAQQCLDCFGHIDLLVNNASVFPKTPIGTIEATDAAAIMAVNATTPVLLSQALAKPLKQQQGCIINLIDIHHHKPLKHHVLYCMSKAALHSATLSLAVELGPEIRVNGVSPGAILWPSAGDEINQQDIINQIPLNKAGHPNDIAKTVAFLACDAPYISGQTISVDGGRTAVGYQGA